jgi:hypothetical protein
MTRLIDFSSRQLDDEFMNDQPMSYGKPDTHEGLGDPICEEASHRSIDAPSGSEAFKIIDLGRPTGSSTWLKRRRKRQQLLKRKS